eukprot:TRINITY_DN14077_c0_g1_i1.p1 TRINITY_DN14077_c0_g1~~TRINITY_DN14077_c0_g1_i1.p1  ORF type:complete len:1340 (-),score=419.61 TRINITY_DN14077_c0_g1_i1:148-4167(-)
MAGIWHAGTLCWAPDEKHAFVAAKVVSSKDGKVTMEVCEGEGGEKVCPADEVMPRSSEQPLVAEMDDLMESNIASVLNNVKTLFSQSQSSTPGGSLNAIYSSVGPVLIAMNPFEEQVIYGQDWMHAYHKAGHDAMEMKRLGPHAYRTAEEAFQGLRRQAHQAVVICGESGAGKTVTNSKMINYLAEIGSGSLGDPSFMTATTRAPMGSTLGRPPPRGSQMASRSSKGSFCRQETLQSSREKIAGANEFLEAFGNAKTTRNDNSSRFGKFTQLYFTNDYVIEGYDIDHYLLERSRVTAQPGGERNYHIFYELLNSSEASTYGLQGGPKAYTIVKDGADLQVKDGGPDFKRLKECMGSAGFTDKEVASALNAIAAVLHLGNVTFKGGKDSSEVDTSGAASAEGLKQACSLLGIEQGELSKAMTSKVIKPPGQAEIQANVGVDEAIAQCGAVMKSLYSQVFDTLVESLSRRMASARKGALAEEENGKVIGLLDIFGFEDMTVNGFEQMFINLTNERIQLLFNTIMFERELKAYEEEGVRPAFDSGPDNLACVNLFTSLRPPGIVKLLNDQVQSGRDGASFVSVLNNSFKDHKYYKVCTFQDINKVMAAKGLKTKGGSAAMDYRECFAINHYAGQVVYTVQNFVPKSRDSLLPHLNKIMLKSGKADVASLFSEETEGKATVGSKFCAQLNELTKTLEKGDTLFVRCIKSNPRKVPGVVDRSLVLEQLVRGGVVAALQIRQAGLPDRLTYKAFCAEFGLLELGRRSQNPKPQDQAKHILDQFVGDSNDFALGHTKVFMRSSVLSRLRATVSLRRLWFVRKVQRAWQIKQKMQVVQRITKLWEHLTDTETMAEDRGIGQLPSVQASIQDSFAKLQPAYDALSAAKMKHLDNADAISAAVDPFSANIKEARFVVDKTVKLVNQVVARKQACDQLVSSRISAVLEAVMGLLERVEGVEKDCADLATVTDPKVQEEYKSFTAACAQARAKLDAMRVECPKFKNTAIQGVSLEDVSSEKIDVADAVPQATAMLKEASTLVEQAEKLGYDVCKVRREFAKAIEELSAECDKSKELLLELDMLGRQCIAEGLDSVTDKMNTAYKLDSQVDTLLQEARDADGFRQAAKNFVAAVQEAKKAIDEARAELERRERERAAREALKSRLDDLNETMRSDLDAAIRSREGKLGGELDSELPTLLQQVSGLLNKLPSVRDGQMGELAAWQAAVEAFESEAQATLAKMNAKVDEADAKRKDIFKQRRSLFGHGANLKSQHTMRTLTGSGESHAPKTLTAEEFIEDKQLGQHKTPLLQIAANIQHLKDVGVYRSDTTQCIAHFTNLSYSKTHEFNPAGRS